MKKSKVYPVMLPTTDEKSPFSCNGEVWMKHLHLPFQEIRYRKHLYLVSDEPIKKGDWAYSEITHVLTFAGEDTESGYSGYKKVEATTDPSLNLSTIPKSFIEKYVEEQGKIEYVYYEIIDYIDYSNNDKVAKKEVIILSVKDRWSREEFRIEMLKAFNEGAYIYGDDFDTWFRENY